MYRNAESHTALSNGGKY